MSKVYFPGYSERYKDFYYKLEKIYDERQKNKLIIFLEDNLLVKEDCEVFVMVKPLQFTKLNINCRNWGMYFYIHELLTKDAALYLRSSLATLQKTKGLTASEGLSYIICLFLTMTDMLMLEKHGVSLENNDTEDYHYSKNEREDLRWLREHFNIRPIRLSLETVLHFWLKVCGAYIDLYLPSPEGAPEGRWFFHTYPPGWITKEQSDDHNKRLEILHNKRSYARN